MPSRPDVVLVCVLFGDRCDGGFKYADDGGWMFDQHRPQTDNHRVEHRHRQTEVEINATTSEHRLETEESGSAVGVS